MPNVACPGCGKLFRVPPDMGGKTMRCINCMTKFQVMIDYSVPATNRGVETRDNAHDFDAPVNPSEVTWSPTVVSPGYLPAASDQSNALNVQLHGPRTSWRFVGAIIVIIVTIGVVATLVWRLGSPRKIEDVAVERLDERREQEREQERAAKAEREARPQTIALHRWWAKPLTPGKTSAVVRAIIDTNSGEVIHITRDATYFRAKAGDDAKLEGSWISIEAGHGNKRPTEEEVMITLLDELDRVEFRDGPGRKSK